ncbi:MAG: Sporulation domain protein [Candidatus Solibacter sp.]|nr:Sporulation domain protein [Candidatus Solibacter sp.]
MRNNETGEFELVVGNKQLLSGFFIVVLLFAVAFAMGYVVGQNAPRSAKMASEGGSSPAPLTSTADARPQPSTPTPVPVSTPTPTGEQPPADSQPQPTTKAAQDPQSPVTDKPAGKPAEAPATDSGIVAAADLPAGNYWQVVAVKAEVTDAVVQTLHGKGFHVVLTPGTSNLIRVLAGPYNDNPSMGRAKTDLENAGFKPWRYKRD